jgi:hypothetical protein
MPVEKPTAERIDLKCPLCPQTHEYDLTVSWMTIYALAGEEKTIETDVTRLFTCPTKDDEFEATLRLSETTRRRLLAVDVRLAADD